MNTKTKKVDKEVIEREIEDMKLRDMTIDSLEKASGELNAMAGRIVELIPDIEFGNPLQGCKDLVILLAPVDEFFQFLKSVEVIFGLDMDKILLGGEDGQTMASLGCGMSAHLDTLLKAFETGDHVTVCDMLEYEIAEGLRKYASVIPELVEIVRNKKVA